LLTDIPTIRRRIHGKNASASNVLTLESSILQKRNLEGAIETLNYCIENEVESEYNEIKEAIIDSIKKYELQLSFNENLINIYQSNKLKRFFDILRIEVPNLDSLNRFKYRVKLVIGSIQNLKKVYLLISIFKNRIRNIFYYKSESKPQVYIYDLKHFKNNVGYFGVIGWFTRTIEKNACGYINQQSPINGNQN